MLLERDEAIGTVKLQFVGAGDRRFVASKTVQLAKVTKKDSTKVEYKSIEQQIKTRDPRTGELISINHHCAEIEKQVPNLFGVTPSIMENVIFCHQEESLWPFSDNNTLKGIFDELFDTKTLTRSYDAMKEQVKKLTKDLKELNIRHDGVRQMQQRLLRERKQVLDQAAEMARISAGLPLLRNKMADLWKADDSWERNSELYKQMLMEDAGFKKERDIRLRILALNTDYCQN